MDARPKPDARRHPLADREAFHGALVRWFAREGRTYPWRETRDPYAILVSEFMLQQTQIATVLDRGYYDRWMSRFPDFETLAEASEDEVLKSWEGLGYYRRAKNLHRLARVVVEEHSGKLPRTLDSVCALPGIGRYTAGAVLSFAYNLPVPLVDGNVLRVFARLFDYAEPVDRGPGERQLWAWAEALVHPNEARQYNSALMELGQRLCSKGQPDCGGCPVADFCQTSEPGHLPKKRARRATVFLDEHVLFARHGGEVRLVREEGSQRTGLWKLPSCPESELEHWPLVYKAKYSITHHRVTLKIYQWSGEKPPAGKWVSCEAVADYALGAPYRKALDALLASDGDFKLSPS